jgi:hypothetical protein
VVTLGCRAATHVIASDDDPYATLERGRQMAVGA